jgi:hypothetical protein
MDNQQQSSECKMLQLILTKNISLVINQFLLFSNFKIDYSLDAFFHWTFVFFKNNFTVVSCKSMDLYR